MGFFQDRTRVRLWSRDYGAYVRADEGREIIIHRDHGTLDEARAAHCLVRDADHYVLFHDAAYDRHLVQIVDGESPGGHETNHAVKCTSATQEQDDIVFEAFRADEQRQRQATQAPTLAPKEPALAMEFFPDRAHVWLWMREYGACLFAGEDGDVIARCGSYGTRHRAWAVHRLVRDGTDYVLFHSAAYGRCLGHIEDEFYHCRPVQCTYDSPEQGKVQASSAGDGSDDIFISNFTFGDLFHPADEDTPMHWVVEATRTRLLPPELPHAIPVSPIMDIDLPSNEQNMDILTTESPVVCFAYRVIGGDLHVLVVDNHTLTGPQRCIHYSELQEVHTGRECKEVGPARALVYPRNSYI